MRRIEFESGKCMLSGVARHRCKAYGIDINGVAFILNGKKYWAYEDPCDGYRSWMCFEEIPDEYIKRVKFYKFSPQEVYIECANNDENGIIIYDGVTNDLVAKIVTKYYYDYYPMAIFEYHPENLYVNQHGNR